MQLEYVDVVFANRPDSNTPMEGRWSVNAQRGTSLTRAATFVKSRSRSVALPLTFYVVWQACLLRGAILARHPFFAVSAGSLASAGSPSSTPLQARSMFCRREIISSPPPGNWHIFGPVSRDATPTVLSFPSTSSHTATLCHRFFPCISFLTSPSSCRCHTHLVHSFIYRLSWLRLAAPAENNFPSFYFTSCEPADRGRPVCCVFFVCFFFNSWGWRTPCGVL